MTVGVRDSLAGDGALHSPPGAPSPAGTFQTEHQLHAAVADYLCLAIQPGTWWSTVGHGGGGTIRGGKLKRLGLVPGIPDLAFCIGGQSAWIELKTEKGTLSPNQKACHVALKEAGALVAVCRSVAEVEGTLRGWGAPLRARRG